MMTHDKFANMTLREHSHVATTHAKCPAYIHTRLHIHSLSQCSFVIVVLHVTLPFSLKLFLNTSTTGDVLIFGGRCSLGLADHVKTDRLSEYIVNSVIVPCNVKRNQGL